MGQTLKGQYEWRGIFSKCLLDTPLDKFGPYFIKYLRMTKENHRTRTNHPTVNDFFNVLYVERGKDSVLMTDIFIPGFLFRNDECVNKYLDTNQTEIQKFVQLKKGIRHIGEFTQIPKNINELLTPLNLPPTEVVTLKKNYDDLVQHAKLFELENSTTFENLQLKQLENFVNDTEKGHDSTKTYAQLTNGLLGDILKLYIEHMENPDTTTKKCQKRQNASKKNSTSQNKKSKITVVTPTTPHGNDNQDTNSNKRENNKCEITCTSSANIKRIKINNSTPLTPHSPEETSRLTTFNIETHDTMVPNDNDENSSKSQESQQCMNPEENNDDPYCY
jgi:hypothetical protein